MVNNNKKLHEVKVIIIITIIRIIINVINIKVEITWLLYNICGSLLIVFYN